MVGTIWPGEHGGPPVFTIVRRERDSAGPNVRPCDHPSFVLDERWSTVTCGRCGERVDAFAVLMHYAEYEERLERRRQLVIGAERSLHVAKLRALADLRALTDAERADISDLLSRHHGAEVSELRGTRERIGRAVAQRRLAARQGRRVSRGLQSREPVT